MKLFQDASPDTAPERKDKMRIFNRTAVGSDIYTLVQEARMGDADRRAAINALRQAEAIVDAMLWVKDKVAAVGTYFLKPSLKH